MTRPIALATCAAFPDGDTDDEALIDALAGRGLAPRFVTWTDPDVDWDGFAATVLRSTWDYTTRRAEFLAWTARVPRLFNPASVVAANSDKSYLAGLAAAGLPVVPTTFSAPGEPVALPRSGEFVLKPTVGAGSRGVGRFDPADPATAGRAAAHAAGLHQAGRTVMVQPYLAEVDRTGETALVYFDGVFSHAVTKGAMLPEPVQHAVDGDALFVAENISPRTPSEAELALGARVLDHLAGSGSLEPRGPSPLLYTRIDLLPGPDGPVLVELELTEPSLFLGHCADAAERFATAIEARIRS